MADNLALKNDKIIFLFENRLIYVIPYSQIIFIEDFDFDIVISFY